eukprot:g2400.t1
MSRSSTLALVGVLASLSAAQEFALSVQDDGLFSITHDGNAWLEGGAEYQAGGLSKAAGSLVTTGAPTKGSGTDALGAYASTTLSWSGTSSNDVIMETSFRTYASDAGLIVFEQSFPSGLGVDAAVAPAPARGYDSDDFHTCRVVTESSFKLTSSANGYSAFTPDAKGVDYYNEHAGHYCDDGHKWAFTANLNQTACQSKCDELKCTCFDHSANPQPGPSPSGGLSARTLFPAFSTGGAAKDLDCFSYHGVFPGIRGCKLSTYAESHQGGAPLAVYDSGNASLPMAVFSPLNFPKAHHMAHSSKGGFVGAGVKSTVTDIPVGWSQLFVLSAGAGVNAGMQAWGDRMLKFTGKARADPYLDDTHATIGFWTDNGGYYHYATGDKKWGSTYEEVLPKVKAYHDSIGVPFGHWQFDSWFYPKDGGVNPGGGGGAVVNWTAMTGPNSGGTKIFPAGMAAIQQALKGTPHSKDTMPMVMHNRQWSKISDYIKHWTDLPWYTDKKAAMAEDPKAFFERFFTQQEGWGLTMYEQDWMCTEYDEVSALQTNITLADLWLEGMADGAAGSGRTVQYCMPYPNDLLAASKHAAVTNARATGDYFHAGDQWAVGATSLFYWAIGILPFKDGFYSSTNKQTGGQTVGPEKNPDRETLMATLSCAMVGPMDGIELLNKTRIMTTCRKDGVVLKPDAPVSTADYCFTAAGGNDPGCKVYTARSQPKGLPAPALYHFNNDAKPLLSAMVGSPCAPYVVYNWYSGEVVGPLADSNDVAAGYEGHVYALVTPLAANKWALLGETSKYVPLSSKRVAAVDVSGADLVVTATGVAGEDVELCAVQCTKDCAPKVCQTAHFDADGDQKVTFSA